MEKFNRFNTKMDGDALIYNGKFVARFKYGKPSGSFKKFLIENFTPTEYFKMYDADPMMTPLAILRTKGYVSPTRK